MRVCFGFWSGNLLTELYTSYGVIYEAVLYFAESASEKGQLP